MNELDLHGLHYDEAEFEIEKFITDNFDELPVKIITGNSQFFVSLLKEIVHKHDLHCHKEMWLNDGCWVITSF